MRPNKNGVPFCCCTHPPSTEGYASFIVENAAQFRKNVKSVSRRGGRLMSKTDINIHTNM